MGPVSTEDPEIVREIEAAIAEAIARFGMAGDVFIQGTAARLVGAGPDAETDIGTLGDQWPTLAPELRQRRATEIARRLVAARRERLDAGHQEKKRGLPQLIAPVVILCLGALGVFVAWRQFGPGGRGFSFGASPSATQSVDDYERERDERARRVCEATRSRIMRGATVGPTDTEGWVVELVLTRPDADPSADPGLGEFFARGDADAGAHRLSWQGLPELASTQGLGSDVVIRAEPIGAQKGMRLTFSGKYVSPYFDGAKRGQYVKLANALAERLKASHGALYAHCAHDRSHHMGGWFLGPTPGEAAATLVYFIGAHADPAQVRANVLFPDGGTDLAASGAFERIQSSAKDIDRKKLRAVLGSHEGMLTGEGEGRTVLTFPFADSNRAARASLALAKTANVGVER